MKNELKSEKPEHQRDLAEIEAKSTSTKHCVVVPGAGFELATSGRLATLALSRL